MAVNRRCPVCGSGKIKVESPSEYHYDHCGLSNVTLVGRGAVRIVHCRECGHVTTTVRDEQQLLQSLGLILLQQPPGMTGEELRYLRRLFGMTQAEMADALELPRRATVADWERKERIFANSRDEITPRVFLIELFRRKVIESDHCFLLPPHVAQFESFAQSFVPFATQELRREAVPRAGFNVRLKRQEEWEPVGAW